MSLLSDMPTLRLSAGTLISSYWTVREPIVELNKGAVA